MDNLLLTERMILKKVRAAQAKGQSYMRPAPYQIETLIKTIDAERERVKILVAFIKRNSHDGCYCKACCDARETLKQLGEE